MVLSVSAVEPRLVAPSSVLKVGEIPISSGKPQVHKTPVSTFHFYITILFLYLPRVCVGCFFYTF